MTDNNKDDLNIDSLTEIINNWKKDEVYDININSLTDLVNILDKNEYDYASIEVGSENAKIIFKKDSISVKESLIKFNVYNNLVLNIKKTTNLDLWVNDIEQKWKNTWVFSWINYEVITKITPNNFWENCLIKVKNLSWTTWDTNDNNENKKSWMSPGKAFWLLATILAISLILGWVFLSFVIYNAQTPQDVAFFTNLGINLNDINSFLQKLTSIVFWVVLVIETLIWIIFLFKTLTTKKENKKKRALNTILSIFMLALLFVTWTFWLALDKKIKTLPNWWELSLWNIQIFDNWLLTSWVATKEESIIWDYKNIIWPVDLKFDLKYLAQEEAKKWFKIIRYKWDFGNWDTLETIDDNIIKTFEKKWTYNVKLILEWEDTRIPWKIREKDAWIPIINITNIVNVTTQKLPNWWATFKFDATDLQKLWKIEWYLSSDFQNPAYVWYNFQPSKIYFDQEIISLKIIDWTTKNKTWMDKFFIVSWETSKINWDINIKWTFNDFEYIFTPKDITNNFWDWFIEKFVWIIEDSKIERKADITNIETSWEIAYRFKNYWNHIIKLQIYNSNGKSSEISKEFSVQKQIKLKNKLSFKIDWVETLDFRENVETNEYSLFDLWVPSKLSIDAKNIRPDNPLYKLENIEWDFWNDWSFESKWFIWEFELSKEWFEQILIVYNYVHRKDPSEKLKVEQLINLESSEKDAILDLKISQSSEYAPSIVKFDASNSKVKDDDIIKFVYDYWDGITEQRDSINQGHRYLKEWNYKVVLTVYTKKWQTFSTSKSVIIKPPFDFVKITSSLKKAPVWQEINFSSSNSVWQIKSYFWDFWDGETSLEANPNHAYQKAWNYKVKLSIDFDNNNTKTDEVNIEIIE